MIYSEDEERDYKALFHECFSLNLSHTSDIQSYIEEKELAKYVLFLPKDKTEPYHSPYKKEDYSIIREELIIKNNNFIENSDKIKENAGSLILKDGSLEEKFKKAQEMNEALSHAENSYERKLIHEECV